MNSLFTVLIFSFLQKMNFILFAHVIAQRFQGIGQSFLVDLQTFSGGEQQKTGIICCSDSTSIFIMTFLQEIICFVLNLWRHAAGEVAYESILVS